MRLMTTMSGLIENGYQLKFKDAQRMIVSFLIGKLDEPVELVPYESTRLTNLLHREKIETIRDLLGLIDRINDPKRQKPKGCGKNTITEMQTVLLEWYWAQLSEKQKVDYLKAIFY